MGGRRVRRGNRPPPWYTTVTGIQYCCKMNCCLPPIWIPHTKGAVKRTRINSFVIYFKIHKYWSPEKESTRGFHWINTRLSVKSGSHFPIQSKVYIHLDRNPVFVCGGDGVVGGEFDNYITFTLHFCLTKKNRMLTVIHFLSQFPLWWGWNCGAPPLVESWMTEIALDKQNADKTRILLSLSNTLHPNRFIGIIFTYFGHCYASTWCINWERRPRRWECDMQMADHSQTRLPSAQSVSVCLPASRLACGWITKISIITQRWSGRRGLKVGQKLTPLSSSYDAVPFVHIMCGYASPDEAATRCTTAARRRPPTPEKYDNSDRRQDLHVLRFPL